MPSPPTNPKPHSTRWHAIWFIYTGFLFIDPLLEPSIPLWAATLTAFASFGVIYPLYIRAQCRPAPLRFWLIGATFLLGLLVFPINQGASCFFIYTAALLPFNLDSARSVLSLFLIELLIIFAEGALFHAPIRLAHAFPYPSHPLISQIVLQISWVNTCVAMVLTGLIGGGNTLFAQQVRAERRLRSALEENLALAAVAERERIARDLHDVLGHTLSVIVLKAELAGRLLAASLPASPSNNADPDTSSSAALRATTEIADVERIARSALADVREAIGGYRTRGLAAEIEAARLTLDAAGVRLIVIHDTHDPAPLDPTQRFDPPAPTSPGAATPRHALNAQEETALSLALREAVTNIVRHAHATTCHLRFLTQSGLRSLVIEDNGQALPTRSGTLATLPEGNGLRGMRARIESLGGQLSLDHHHGTRLQIDLPTHLEAQ